MVKQDRGGKKNRLSVLDASSEGTEQLKTAGTAKMARTKLSRSGDSGIHRPKRTYHVRLRLAMVLSTKALALGRGSKVSGQSLGGHYELCVMGDKNMDSNGTGYFWRDRKSVKQNQEKGNVAPFKKIPSSPDPKIERSCHFRDVKLPS
jgi:hypothetical protein